MTTDQRSPTAVLFEQRKGATNWFQSFSKGLYKQYINNGFKASPSKMVTVIFDCDCILRCIFSIYLYTFEYIWSQHLATFKRVALFRSFHIRVIAATFFPKEVAN